MSIKGDSIDLTVFSFAPPNKSKLLPITYEADSHLITRYEECGCGSRPLHPGESILVYSGIGETNKVVIPKDQAAIIISKSTAFRNGLMITPGFADSGYDGPIASLVYNASPYTFSLKKGIKLLQMILMDCESATDYSEREGSHYGNRVTHTKNT